MSETLGVLSFNTHDAFDNDASAAAVIKLVEQKKPNIIGFTEASSAEPGHDPSKIEEAKLALEAMGYQTTYVPYQTVDRRNDDHYMLAAHNIDGAYSLERHDTVRSRLDIWLPDQPAVVSISHFVERIANKKPHFGSDLRLVQAEHLPSGKNYGIVRMGDHNNANPDVGRGRYLKHAKRLAALLPVVEPGTELDSLGKKIGRAGSILQRAADMPNGEVYNALLMDGYLTDANKYNDPTHKIGMAIDTLAHSPHFEVTKFRVPKDPETNEYTDDNNEAKSISDHWPLVATLAINS